MIVQHLLHTEIDKPLWDDTLLNSQNTLVYATSWYLDAMCPYWEALVFGNYEFIMPLPVKVKFGIKYVYQPFLTAQLGIFSSQPINEAITTLFFNAIADITKFAEYDCNYACPILEHNCTPRQNYILSFNNVGYDAIGLNFNRLAHRKIKKASEEGLVITENIDAERILDLCKADIVLKKINYDSHVFKDAMVMLKLAEQKKHLHTIGCLDANGSILASIAYIIFKNRIYSLIAGNQPDAKNYGAFYFVLNALIKKYAHTNYIFDFEGSDIEGIAFVFKNLGGQPQPFFNYRHNNLPFPLNKIKK